MSSRATVTDRWIGYPPTWEQVGNNCARTVESEIAGPTSKQRRVNKLDNPALSAKPAPPVQIRAAPPISLRIRGSKLGLALTGRCAELCPTFAAPRLRRGR